MTTDQVVQLAGILVTLVTVVLTYLSTRRKVGDVHTLVNQNNDDLRARVDQLGQTIQETGGKIPPTPPRMIPLWCKLLSEGEQRVSREGRVTSCNAGAVSK